MKMLSKIMMILVTIGGINWGLVGLGHLLDKNLNIVNLLVGTWPMVETIVYLLVGISAIVLASQCMSKKCSCCK
jgi:uncharacterized membrane protein YuzA (DUF378 family)